MSFIGYYAWHSFINQIRKLFKTWVLIFILICGLIGGGIGYFSATLMDAADNEPSIYVEEEDPWEEEAPLEDSGEGDIELPEDFDWESAVEAQEELDLFSRGPRYFELAFGGMVYAALIMSLVMAEWGKGSRFLSADVSLLFASPLKPQTVLLFRLVMQLGLTLYFTVYLGVNIGNIMTSLGAGTSGIVGAAAAWLLALIFGKLIETYVYLLKAGNGIVRRNYSLMLGALLAVPAAALFAFAKANGTGLMDSALDLFCAPWTRYIPVWGWLKGAALFSLEGRMGISLLFLALTAACAALFGRAIWSMKTDFYEDAMARSEQLAQAMAEMTEKNRTFGRIGKKKIAEDIERDGMKRGAGSSVFFWKTIINRGRFSKLWVISKTSGFYLALAAAASLFAVGIAETRSVIPAVCAIGAGVFFRALGDPIEDDTKTVLTAMIPESAVKKLCWSSLGGAVVCLLDLVPALIATAAIVRQDIPLLLLCVPLILTVDLYAGSTGSFLALVTPANAGTVVKQFIQVMFIYFGLLPDIGIIAAGIALGHRNVSLFAAALVNVLLSMVFISGSANMLEPRIGRPAYSLENCPGDPKEARACFSRIGISLFAMMGISQFLQLLVFSQYGDKIDMSAQPWLFWFAQMAPLYLVAVPIGLLLMRKLPASAPAEPLKLSFRGWLLLVPAAFFLLYGGNIIGSGLSLLLAPLFKSVPAGPGDINPLIDLFDENQTLPRAFVMVICAPIIEEIIFRRVIIGRTRRYGERNAVLFSAVTFGLLHGNIPQAIYAGLLGLLLGAVYIKTGRLIHTIAIHMTVNFMGGVVAPAVMMMVLNGAEDDAFPPQVIAFYAVIALLFTVGASIWIRLRGRVSFEPAPQQILPRDARGAWLNAGVALFALLSLFSMIMTLAA
jgi:membrane protease YdiL (CAAX protease family)